MTKTVTATIVLQPVDASTLPGTVAGYRVTLTEAAGAVLTQDVLVDATSATIPSVPAGVWTPSVFAIDSTGAELTPSVAGAAITIVDVVNVNVPLSISATAA